MGALSGGPGHRLPGDAGRARTARQGARAPRRPALGAPHAGLAGEWAGERPRAARGLHVRSHPVPSPAAWSPTLLTAVTPEGDGLTTLVLDVAGTPLVGSHLRPGQYTQVRLEGTDTVGTFAIASPPGPGPRWELLVRAGSEVPDALARLRPGARVEAMPALGPGFPLDAARGKDVVLVGTGSGIAPLRSVIGALGRERRAWGEVTLFFGARTPQGFAYAHEVAHWEEAGVRVVRTVSQPGESGWAGLTGYVQGHLGEQLVRARMPQSVAFVCGQPEMVEGVTAALVGFGMPRASVFVNY